jgi:hypothetical protein
VGNNDIVERVHLKVWKTLLHVKKKSTTDLMVYGELGRFPLGIYVKLRIINYWAKLLTGKQEKILAILYNFSLLNYRTNIP